MSQSVETDLALAMARGNHSSLSPWKSRCPWKYERRLRLRTIWPEKSILKGMHEGDFLISPHTELAQYAEQKGQDYDRWISGMRRMRRGMVKQNPEYDYKR